MKHFLLIASLCCAAGAALPAAAQHTMSARPDPQREVNFIYEFIERFNDDMTSNLRKIYLRTGKPINFTRPDLIRSLFEPPSAKDEPAARQFVAQVDDSLHPQRLSFTDSGWYAEVQCAFTTGGRKLTIPLVMQVNTAADNSSKWMIAGIGDSPVFQESTGAAATVAPTRKDSLSDYISPSDYATNFLDLHRILKPTNISGTYLVPELMATERGKKFVQLLQSGKLSFDYPGTMKFYFFQIPNYTFAVERFVRNTMHSGWLISSLEPSTDSEKAQRKARLLQRTL